VAVAALQTRLLTSRLLTLPRRRLVRRLMQLVRLLARRLMRRARRPMPLPRRLPMRLLSLHSRRLLRSSNC
jgi:hypothetical protein